MLSRIFLVFNIAARNLLLSGRKSLNVGAVIAVAAMTAVLADAFVSTILDGMRRSIVESVSGDIQLYSQKARDPLALFGSLDGDAADIGQIDDFDAIKQSLMTNLPEIKAMLPMGTNYAAIRPGNLLDQNIEALRHLYQQSPRDLQVIAVTEGRIRELVRKVSDVTVGGGGGVIRFDKAAFARMSGDIATVLKDDFWRLLARDPEPSLEFLANRIAPLLIDNTTLVFGYIGAPLAEFAEAMPLFELARGAMVPPGAPGLLINEHTYETLFKDRIAKNLDALQAKISAGESIAQSNLLTGMVRANQRQSEAIARQLDTASAQNLSSRLNTLLAGKTAPLTQQLRQFFDMTDANFSTRYRFFYAQIAPHINLYQVPLGAMVAVNAISRRGPETLVNLKLYGTFRFRGLEGSSLAGALSLIDLASFRRLSGFPDAATRQELDQIAKEMGAADLEESAIGDLFSQENGAKANGTPSSSGRSAKGGASASTPLKPAIKDGDAGVCLHAAVVLKDSTQRAAVMGDIRRLIGEKHLPVKAVDAAEASGLLGQWMQVVAYTLMFSLTVMFGIVALIVAGAMVLVAFGRKREIGTMRAIGARRDFIKWLMWTETLLLNMVFGIGGLVLGAAAVMLINRAGIVITSENMQFFLSGSRLHLGLATHHFGWIMASLLLLSLITGWLPVKKALAISPISAMQTHE